MKETAIRELVILPVQIGSTDLECMILIGNRLDELTLKKAEFHQDIINQLMAILVPVFLEALPSRRIHNIRKILFKGFMYCFDKAVEDIYNLRARPTANVTFDLNDILTGETGDEIPEYIQLKVRPYIGAIATIYNKVVDHIEEIEIELLKNGVNYEDLLKCIFYGGTLLGTEFSLRIDLEDSHELDHFLSE